MIAQQDDSTKSRTGAYGQATGDTKDNASDKSMPVVHQQSNQGIYTIDTSATKMKRVPSIRNSIAVNVQDLNSPALKNALELNPRFVDPNVHKTMDRLNSYTMHQSKLIQMELEKKMK